MDFSSSFQALLMFPLGFLLVYASFKMTRQPKTGNRKMINSHNYRVPKPLGALPRIGHLHLLGGQDPVAPIRGAMADKYGPLLYLKLGQHRALVVSNWELVKEWFTTNERLFANRPNIAIGKYVSYDSAAFAVSP